MNSRNTIQRSLVLDAVNELKSHATADEVYDAVVKKYPEISRATVYRNLNLLSDIGEILKVETPNGAIRYDHNTHKHYHVKCEKCRRIFDVEMDVIAGLEENIVNTRGFEFTGHDIVFKGICPECNT